MADEQILRNECEQAVLQLENAYLKCLGDGDAWTPTVHIAEALRLHDLFPGSGSAFSRMLAERLMKRGLVEIDRAHFYGQWVKVRRKHRSRRRPVE